MQFVYTVSKHTCRGLFAGGAACLYGFQTYLHGTVCCRCSLFLRFPNLPAGTVFWRCSLFYTVSKPTCRRLSVGGAACLYGFQTYLQGLSFGGAACLYGFQTYLQGTVGWRCCLFIRFPNLPAGDCLLEVQLVYTVSKPTCRGLSVGGAACLYGFQTYLQGTVCCRCSLFIRFPNLPAGDCLL